MHCLVLCIAKLEHPMNKTVGIILAIIFVVFSYLQVNDEDSEKWFWVLLYLYVASVIGFAAFGQFRLWAAWLGIGVCLGWMISILPEFINWVQMGMPTITGQMKATEPHIEYTREFLGLGLSIGALGYTIWANRSER